MKAAPSSRKSVTVNQSTNSHIPDELEPQNLRILYSSPNTNKVKDDEDGRAARKHREHGEINRAL
jgi:hypothetical protein